MYVVSAFRRTTHGPAKAGHYVLIESALGSSLDAQYQRVNLRLEPRGVLDLRVQRSPHFQQQGFYPSEACADGAHDGEDDRGYFHTGGTGFSFRHRFDSRDRAGQTWNARVKEKGSDVDPFHLRAIVGRFD